MESLDRRPRIAFIITSLRHGGAEGQLTTITTGLAKLGWKINIITLLPYNDYQATLSRAGVDVLFAGSSHGRPNPLTVLLRVRRILFELRPDALVTFLYHADMIGRLAGRLAGVPKIIASFRNEQFGSPFRDKLMRLMRGIPDAFVANFQSATLSLADRKLADAERLFVVPNGISLNQVDGQAEHPTTGTALDHVYDIQRFIWIAVGRLEPQKDHRNLFDAAARLRDSGINFILLVCGAGSLSDDLGEYARNLGLTPDYVRFLGHCTNIQDLLKICDAFVLSSSWEGMPNALMEAMASALPAVATDVGGVPDLLKEVCSKCMVPARNPQRLSEAMRHIMDLTPDARRELGVKGKHYLQSNFSADALVKAWYRIIQEQIQG